MSQEALANVVFIVRNNLSLIELGKRDCENDLLEAIKKALGVEGAPLRESERPEFRERLYKWHNVIIERDWPVAKEMQKKLSVIKSLPRDKELNVLYSLFDCRMLIGTGDLKASKDILDDFETRLDELSDIQLYHYNDNQGTWNAKSGYNNEALAYYLKVFDFTKRGLEKNLVLYYNIAICYYRVGCIARSVSYLEKAAQLYSNPQKSISEFHIDFLLATNYTRTGNLQRAKIVFDKCYAKALSDNNKTYLGMVLINQGYMYRKAKKWNTAIEHIDRAFDYVEKGNPNYLEALYQKTRCLIQMERFLLCKDLLAEGAELSKDDETYSILFKSLNHLTNLKVDSSVRYIEDITIPHLLEKNLVIAALDYCEVLKTHYEEKGRGFQTKMLKMAEIICNIREKLLEGDVVE